MGESDHTIGYFAVLGETATRREWLFYKAPYPDRARQMAMLRQDVVDVVKVIMITKTQYQNGVDNLKAIEQKKNNASKKECASRLEFQRRKDREQNAKRRQKLKQIA
jgi:hypothetical protein